MTPWPCSTCNAPGVRNLGTDGYCAVHLARLYGRFDPAVWQMDGIGLPGRSTNPDDLQCRACGATWVGIPGEVCAWCARSLERLHEWQAQTVLTPPDVDPDDINYHNALVAWAKRLDVAVNAGIVDRHTAERAVLRKKTTRAA